MANQFDEDRPYSTLSSGTFIENSEGKLLLLRRANTNLWGPPAGGIASFESPIAAAMREAREETGFEIEILRLLLVPIVFKNEKRTNCGFAFLGKKIGGTIKLDESEADQLMWCDKRTVKHLIIAKRIYKHEYNAIAFENWLGGKSYPLEIISVVYK